MYFSLKGFEPEDGETLNTEETAINDMLAIVGRLKPSDKSAFVRIALPILMTHMTDMHGPEETIGMLLAGVDCVAAAHGATGITFGDGYDEAETVELPLSTETRH